MAPPILVRVDTPRLKRHQGDSPQPGVTGAHHGCTGRVAGFSSERVLVALDCGSMHSFSPDHLRVVTVEDRTPVVPR